MSLDECLQCGQKLRAGWRRCPRCRLLIAEAAGPGREATTPAPRWRQPAWLWAASAGLAIVAIVAFSVGRSEPPTPVHATAPASAAAAGVSALQPTSAREAPDSAESDDAMVHQALDSVRSGNAAYATGDLVAALAAFEAAVAAAPEDAEARNNLGQVLIRQGKAAQALPHFDEAARLVPDKWTYRFNRARAYGELERWPQAVTEYEVAARLFPDDFAAYYNMGLALMHLKRYPEAVVALEQAIARAPEEPGFLIQLGTAQIGAERPDRARAVFEQFLERAPNDPEVPRVKALLEALAAAPAAVGAR